ncbi:MAG: hypothetical protein V1911_04050 [Candidatus Micrarchaeota archaeon]
MVLIHLDEPRHSAKISRDQAKKILKIRPDIVVFEYPQDSSPGEFFNKFSPKNKPLKKFWKIKKGFLKQVKKYPWLKGDVEVLEAIEKLWSEGRQVFLYNMDAPRKITKICDEKEAFENRLLHDALNRIREQYMIKMINKISKKHKRKKIIVLCHDYHWKNLKFLMKKPSKRNISEHYFSNVDEYVRFYFKKYPFILQCYKK